VRIAARSDLRSLGTLKGSWAPVDTLRRGDSVQVACELLSGESIPRTVDRGTRGTIWHFDEDGISTCTFLTLASRTCAVMCASSSHTSCAWSVLLEVYWLAPVSSLDSFGIVGSDGFESPFGGPMRCCSCFGILSVSRPLTCGPRSGSSMRSTFLSFLFGAGAVAALLLSSCLPSCCGPAVLLCCCCCGCWFVCFVACLPSQCYP
jgi:hypothetical protein